MAGQPAAAAADSAVEAPLPSSEEPFQTPAPSDSPWTLPVPPYDLVVAAVDLSGLVPSAAGPSGQADPWDFGSFALGPFVLDSFDPFVLGSFAQDPFVADPSALGSFDPSDFDRPCAADSSEFGPSGPDPLAGSSGLEGPCCSSADQGACLVSAGCMACAAGWLPAKTKTLPITHFS